MNCSEIAQAEKDQKSPDYDAELRSATRRIRRQAKGGLPVILGFARARWAELSDSACSRLHAAEDYVRKSDAERAAFVKEHLDMDATAPLHYDLVLNTSRLSSPACRERVLKALRALQERALS